MMGANTWIHIIVFITVFIFTGVILSHRAKKKKSDKTNFDYNEIRAEVVEAEDIMRQAQNERARARKELKEAEELKRKAASEWAKIRSRMKASYEDMKNPYQVLGVDENDSLEMIKEHYQKLVQTYDPERIGDAEGLSKKEQLNQLKKIEHSYNWIITYHKQNS